jgi:ferredoxin
MPVRKIIKIDEDLCDGCGNCIPSCEEGALQIVDGKAKLVKEIFCDGLGACLGDCPQGALTIEEREAKEFDEKAVEEHLSATETQAAPAKPAAQPDLPCGCPGSAMRTFAPADIPTVPSVQAVDAQSTLTHWPVQLKLVPVGAPFLKGADLLICADCVPFTVPDFHSKYLQGRSVLVGCPKLDDLEFYQEKLKGIFAAAQPTSITVLRMEVPCCGGLNQAVEQARDEALPHMPVVTHTMGIRGGSHREVSPGRQAAAQAGR